ncbi:MAG: hypothetical protein ACKO1N_06355, partial [Erythrobacter sp.]
CARVAGVHIIISGLSAKPPESQQPQPLNPFRNGLLDIMLCDIARMRSKSTEKVKLPFEINEFKLKERLTRSPFPRLGQDVNDAILRVKPYRDGGNATLRKLSDLNNLDKHELMIPSIGTARVSTFGFGSFLASFGSTETLAKSLMTQRQAEQCLGTIDAKLEFWFTEGGFPDLEAVPALLNFAQASEEVVEAFAAEFGQGHA